MSENIDDPIEQIIRTLEMLIKTEYKIQEERSYSNHREVWRLRDEVYSPVREELKTLLRDLIKTKVD